MTSLPGRRFVDIYKNSLICVPCKSSEVLSINEINTYIKTVNGQFRLLPLSDKEATANGTCHTVLPVFVPMPVCNKPDKCRTLTGNGH